MEATNKFIYLKHRKLFDQLTIPNNLNPIIFVEDTNQLWTCGHWFSIGYPSLTATQSASQISSVTLHLGADSSLDLLSIGGGLSIYVNEKGNVVFNSSSLVTINTESPLHYDSTKNLIYHTNNKTQGSYGPISDQTNTRSFTVPYVTVDDSGHITSAVSRTVSISNEIRQLKKDDGIHRILLSYSNTDNDETGQTFKSSMYYQENTLTVPGFINIDNTTQGSGIVVNKGNIEIIDGVFKGKFQGDLTGSALPKIHLSLTQDYGGASTQLFGHVKLQDVIPTEDPGDSSSNTDTTDTTNSSKSAIAATPKMIYDTIKQIRSEELKFTAYKEDNKVAVDKTLNFTRDFTLDSANNLSITIEEIKE